jgi:hypothetical protein
MDWPRKWMTLKRSADARPIESSLRRFGMRKGSIE